TTQEYFDKYRVALFPNAESEISGVCLTYLSFDVFAEGPCTSDKDLEVPLQQFPFLHYAAHHWGHHLRGKPEKNLEKLVLKFLENNSKLMCSTQVMHLPEYRYSGYSQRFPKRATGLQIAASFGLV